MLEISGDGLTLDNVFDVAYRNQEARLTDSARQKMQRSRDFIETEIEKGSVIYGVNTGFGALSSVRISPADIAQLQVNLIRSHSAGVGTPFSPEETRAILLLRANALARGHSGIRPLVVDKLLEFLNLNILPVIPSQGSLGASGDLAPLAHLALALIGEGEVWQDGQPTETAKLLKQNNVEPLTLASKEGLSLINGCQVMTAIGLLTSHHARQLVKLADIAGAMSLEALRGSRSPMDSLISATRPHAGEQKTARNLRRLLEESSELSESHRDCDRVQDAYSLRCMPAVHGAVKDSLRRAIEVLEVEANSSTDNPLVFTDAKKVLSCGNFHGEPVAFQMDFLAIAMNSIGNISQCRISRLINPAFSRLPIFLAPDSGLNSGLMVVEYAAASLVSENKVFSHPASVDSIPTSVDKEDHVSMGTIAARKLKNICANVENILAMEMLTSMQGLSLLLPLKPSLAVKSAFDLLLKGVPLAKTDRVFAKDIQHIRENLGLVLQSAEKVVGELEW